MLKKKVIVTMLICFLCVNVLAGCNSDNNSGSTADSGSKSTSNTAVGDDEKVKLTALINKHSLTEDIEKMQWMKELEDKCNVEIEWQQISADWDQKKSAMFASGNIPDILFNATTDADYIQYDGLFEDLDASQSRCHHRVSRR